MKPVAQTTFGNPGGNCFSACVASILELPIEDVPYFMTGDNWWIEFVEWCAARGVRAVFHDRREGSATEYDLWPTGYSIKTGQSPRHPPPSYHAVVAFNGLTVHDPRVDDPRGVLAPIIDYITLEPF